MTYIIEYLDWDENYIRYIDTAEIIADDELSAINEFKLVYGAEIVGIEGR